MLRPPNLLARFALWMEKKQCLKVPLPLAFALQKWQFWCEGRITHRSTNGIQWREIELIPTRKSMLNDQRFRGADRSWWKKKLWLTIFTQRVKITSLIWRKLRFKNGKSCLIFHTLQTWYRLIFISFDRFLTLCAVHHSITNSLRRDRNISIPEASKNKKLLSDMRKS